MGQIYRQVTFNQSNKVQNSSYKNNNLSLAEVYEPTNGGSTTLNIIKDFHWTFTPKTDEVIKEVPYIKLTEYYLFDSYLNQLFKSYGQTLNGIDPGSVANVFLNPFILNALDQSTQLYQGLYDHVNPTGFVYKFPYFNKEHSNTSNSWVAKPMFQEIMNLQKKVVGYGTAIGAGAAGGIIGLLLNLIQIDLQVGGLDVAKRSKRLSERTFELEKLTEILSIGLESPIANMQDPAIDKPHIWSTTVPRSFNISFPLYNTVTQPDSTNWYSNIVQNWELCHLLTYQNLYNKRNLFTGIPPVFYEIDVPGIHYTKAGYISNLEILNVGNIRNYSLPLNGANKKVNVPDAYFINMTVTDFFMPSKNFMSSLCNSRNSKPSSLLQSGTTFETANAAGEATTTTTLPVVITPVGPVTPAN